MAYKAKDQFFPPVVEGNVKVSGDSANLGIGEVAFVDINGGVKILTDFAPLSPEAKLAIRMGEPNDNVSRSEDNKAISTIPFKIQDVVNVYVDAPDRAGILVDDFIIGFNGEDGSEIELENGENEVIELCLKGDLMGMIGLPDSKHIARVNIQAPIDGVKGTDWFMEQIIEDAFLTLKDYKLPGNIAITEYVDIMLVNSNNPVGLPGTATTFYNLVLVDEGTQTDLGKVQAQYADSDVKRLKWESGKSTYSVIASAAPADYQGAADFLLKGCEDCPAGYSEFADGFVYCVARRGVTGAKSEFDTAFSDYLDRCRTATNLPLAVGFGIRDKEDVKAITGVADIAVIGSRTIQLVDEKGPEAVGPFISSLR